ncbi:hypothetical protein GGI19_005126 [Coemansia pectinata]|uniref:F-box domain-containing protein n=1 Tax=Coemansia pectinata TaxID=1052879 RepID=A0A9W8GWJ6_9FUNG|nr:hypothetical protein GGI19_005126 [Coemansia pectinata]
MPASLHLLSLPVEILLKIVSYVDKPTQLERYTTQFSSEETCNQIAPLLSVCEVLRALAFERVCAKCSIEINDDSGQSLVTFEGWPKCQKLPHASTIAKYARRVSLKVDFWDILNGDACEILENAAWIQSAFPNVVKLNVLIIGNFIGGDFYTLEAKRQNMIQFAQSIRTIMPKASKVKIELDNGLKFIEKSQATSQLLNSLVETLYRDSVQRHLKIYVNEFQIGMLPSCITGLTHVVASIHHDSHATMMLLHKSAHSLQSLEMNFHNKTHVSYLVSGYDSSAIEYPNLYKLVLAEWTIDTPHRKPSTGNKHIPFPKLKLLSVDMEYPFSDETLFKGNSRTLECLMMRLDPITIDMLRTSDTFANGQYAKLRNVTVKSLDPFSEVQSISDYIYTSFVLKMSPALQVFIDKAVIMDHNKLSFFHNSPNLTGLRILNLPEMTVHMSSLVPLLKSLRQLEAVECKYILDDLGMSADCVRSTYYPLSARLKFISLTAYEEACDDVFRSIILLALVCPALMRCHMPHDWREKFNSYVDSTVEAQSLSLYQDRLLAIKYVEY